MMFLQLSQVPVCVDPAAAALEVKVQSSRLGAPVGRQGRWLIMARLQPGAEELPFSQVAPDHVQIFGDGAYVHQSSFMLIYDEAGRLMLRADRLQRGHWQLRRYAPEHAGRMVLVPSVRLAFAEASEARQLAELCRQGRLRTWSRAEEQILLALVSSSLDAVELPVARTRKP